MFSERKPEPRRGPNWFTPEQFISLDVVDWKPNTELTISASNPGNLNAYPVPLSEMKLNGWRAQAVVRFNPFERTIGDGPGNGYSQAVKLGAATGVPVLNVNRIVPQKRFTETKWVKLLKVKSRLLSRFYERDMYLRASVRLPASYYDQPKKRYPTIFTIPGFGGTHRVRTTGGALKETHKQGVEFLRVQLDPSCPRGHHVFADSENNGPVGQALISELIPAFNRKFRSIAKADARFLTGHSSGGWSSLWLMVRYPDQFAGTWSTSPDPVDFRDFQQINLYKPGENMYVDSRGKPRPLARSRGNVLLWYKGFADMEWTLGYGGQLHSFEAVFSRKKKDGTPELLWDRKTGKINTRVAQSWKKYDIRLILESRWKTLGPKLKGKLHVFMGDADTFYLEGATVLLKKSLEELKSDAVVEIHPGKNHFTLLSRQMRDRIVKEMVDAFLKNYPDYGKNPNQKPGRMTLNAFPIKKNGSLGKKRVLVDFGKEVGTDGMTVDAAGNIYAAVRSSKRHGIIVYSPQGKEKAYIPTDDLPTNCCFGIGDEANTLYITAGKGLFRITLKSKGFHPATAK
eukprot:g8380.t1